MALPIVVADAETHYSQTYSLSHISTEEYIRSPLFQSIGWSIWMPDEAAPVWYPGPLGEAKLRSLDWDNLAWLSHNTHFDGAIAAWRYGIHPKLYLDTMAMGQPLFGFTSGVSLAKLAEVLGVGVKGDEVVRALGKRLEDFTPQELADYGRYCCNDTVLCRRIFEKLLPLTPRKELALIDENIRLFTDPRLVLDKGVLEEYYEEVVEGKKVLFHWLAMLLGVSDEEAKTCIMSNDKLALALQELGVDPPMKTSKTTGNPAYAFAKTDEAFLELKGHDNEAVQTLVEARLGGKSTLAESRALRLIGVAARGTLPVQLKYYAAHPGRFGGDGKLNLQNLPRNKSKTEMSKLRHAIMAPPFHQLVVADLSQIEARIVAYVSGQDDVLEVFAANDRDPDNNPDVYCATATMLFGVIIVKADTLRRFIGKTCRLGLAYMTGKDKLFLTLKKDKVPCTLGQCEDWVNKFRSASPYIVKFWRDCDRALAALLKGESFVFGRNNMFEVKADGIHLPNGLVLRYPGLEGEEVDRFGNGRLTTQYSYLNRKKRQKVYSGLVCENICQCLARSVCTEAWLRIRHKVKVVMQAHDELVTVVHDDQVEEALVFVKDEMIKPVPWLPGMPINADVGAAQRYSEAKP